MRPYNRVFLLARILALFGQQCKGAKLIAQYLDIDRNKLDIFQTFVSSVKGVISRCRTDSSIKRSIFPIKRTTALNFM